MERSIAEEFAVEGSIVEESPVEGLVTMGGSVTSGGSCPGKVFL